jgi:hypothetical protein
VAGCEMGWGTGLIHRRTGLRHRWAGFLRRAGGLLRNGQHLPPVGSCGLMTRHLCPILLSSLVSHRHKPVLTSAGQRPRTLHQTRALSRHLLTALDGMHWSRRNLAL